MAKAVRDPVSPLMPTALNNGQRSPRKLLRAVVPRLLGRKP
jgi:hypothetical protein